MRHKVVLPDCRGPVRVITGKYLKYSLMVEAIALFISVLFVIWPILRLNFKFVRKFSALFLIMLPIAIIFG